MKRLARLGGILAALLVVIAAPALAQQGTARFDHSKTGFPLTGAHMTAECVTCHINGRLAGTPRQCVACHNGTIAHGAPANHLPSAMPCDTCHRTAVTFGNAPMNHAGIAGSCETCHTGQSFFGVTPVSKSATHVSTGTITDCKSCHRSYVSFAGAAFAHSANVSGQCYSCHGSGTNGAKMEGAGHVATKTVSCDACHKSTATGGFAVFTMGSSGHTTLGVSSTSDCTGCHMGGYTGVAVKPASHSATNPAKQNCADCHKSFTSFSGASFTHPANAAGQCYSCHGTGTGGAKVEVASHVPTGTASCDACHSSTNTGGFSTFTMGSAGHTALGVSMTSNCTSCHMGSYLGVVVKPSGHSATASANQNCSDSNCHSSFTSFSGVTYTHTASAAGQCYTCHGTGSGGAKKEVAGHVPTGTASCDACHSSTSTNGFSTFTMGSAGHTALGIGMTSDCTSCHMGSYLGVVVKPSGHSATATANQNCSDSNCHSSFTSFSGVTYTHTASAAGQCYTCHGTGSGGAKKEVAGHVPTGTASCDACHSSTSTNGFSTFTMGSAGHTALGISLTSDCTSCHMGSYLGVMVKPSGHSPTATANQNCSASGCHGSFTSFSGATYKHTTASSGKCYTCHGAGTGGGMKEGASHVPTGTVSCDACHTNTNTGGFGTFTMGSSGHSALGVTMTSSCISCHTGTYTGVAVKPAAHVPYATGQNCSASGCHSSFASFSGAVYNHSGVTSGTCYSCHGTGQYGAAKEGSGHVPTASVSCDVCHTSKSVGGFNTFTMGTAGHTALGVSTSSNCTTCHQTANYTGVVLKPTGHSTTTPSNQNCYDCHKTFTSFSGASYSHSASASGNCYSCHGTGVGGAMKEVAGHVPTKAVSCDVCHKAGTAKGAFGTYTMGNAGHQALGVQLATSDCMTCHNGSYLGTSKFKPHPGKDKATTANANYCGQCHKSFTKAP